MSARASRRRPRRARRTGRGRRRGGSLGDVEADECGADRACGGSELCGDDAYPVAHGTERLALHDLERRRDQELPAGDAEAPADDDQLRREDVREGSHRRAEVAADVGKDLARLTVALVREPDQTVRVGRRAEGVLRRQRRGETGDIRLEMAVPAAGALAGTAFMDDHHVAELDARAAVTAEGAAARDPPAAEACPEREHHHVLYAASGAGPPFADRRGIGIVVEAHRKPEAIRHVLAKREVAKREVHALDDNAVDQVDRRRDTEPDRRHLVAEERGNGRLELTDDRFLRVVRRLALVPPDDLAFMRNDGGKDLRAAKVDPDRMRAVHPQWVP